MRLAGISTIPETSNILLEAAAWLSLDLSVAVKNPDCSVQVGPISGLALLGLLVPQRVLYNKDIVSACHLAVQRVKINKIK